MWGYYCNCESCDCGLLGTDESSTFLCVSTLLFFSFLFSSSQLTHPRLFLLEVLNKMAGLLFIFSVAILPLTLLSAHTDAGVTKQRQRKAPGLGVIPHHNERHFPSLPDIVSSYPLKGGSDDITTTRNSAPNLREKRFADGSYVPILSKRIREFVGKRGSGGLFSRQFREQPTLEDKARYLEYAVPFIYVTYNPYLSTADLARIREFVGKRDSLSLDKRIREFVGKRDSLSMDKRIREFVGKRDSLDKRIREFVGKRDSFSTDKRIREFVGKRNSFDKRIREFVGKRNNRDKRIREFVGKRGGFSMDKRIREFVGKRGSFSMDKRIREFVGKRGLEEFIKSAAPVLRDCGRLCGEEEGSIRDDILQLGQKGATNPDDPSLLIREEPIFPAKSEQLLNKRIREFVEKSSQEPDKVFVPHIPDTGTRKESLVDIRDILDYLSNMEKLIPEFDRERENPVMQRNRDFVDFDFHKRIREFVGKRDHSNLDGNRPIHGLVNLRDLPDLDINKRIREFVGKRDQPEADFGKRLKELLKEGSLPTTDINKSLHEFLEKRDSSEFEINKRIREFVGK